MYMEQKNSFLKMFYNFIAIAVLIFYDIVLFFAFAFSADRHELSGFLFSTFVVNIIFLQALFTFSSLNTYIKSSIIRTTIKITRLLIPFLIIPFHLVYFVGL